MKAIDTGMGVAFLRAYGMLYPKEKRLFEDPFAEKLLTPFYRFFLFLMRSPKIFDFLMRLEKKSTPGKTGWLLCRIRYINDVLKDSIAKKEIKTIVNLGAGMDCRAYYIPGVEKIRYFEVDHPKVIKKKKAKMKKILGKLPNHVTYVPVDFEKQSLDVELEKAGYDLTSKTLFIWEGVSQYISKEANENTMKYVAQAAPGSKIVFTYILKSLIEGKDLNDIAKKGMYKWMVKWLKMWIYGLDPKDISDYLSKYNLSLIEDIGSKEMKERYMKKVNLGLDVFEIERIALAKVIKNT
ncbi:class I SAM-dependent methyltransferase [Candidatus Woesearchaeota archaeon]|nr:class I SAM-dependent methyltransferase [Candidatus Woesearchaeota archaeon]